MAGVVGIHEILLRPEVEDKPEEFERFVAEEFAPEALKVLGAKVRLCKGIRGDRIGRYALFFEFPTTDAFARFWPLGPGPMTEEGQRFAQEHSALFEKHFSFVDNFLFTDYVETGK